MATSAETSKITLPLDAGCCVIRPYQPDDRDDLVRNGNNRRIARNMRNMFPSPFTLANADAWIQKTMAESPPLNCAITVGGEVAGGIGLMLQDDCRWRTAEIGYWLGENFWGHGIAPAAVRAFTGYGFQTFNLLRVFAGVFSWNPASMRVLEKVGFKREGVMRHDVVKEDQILDRAIYAITREEFFALPLQRGDRAGASGKPILPVQIRKANENDLEAINEVYNEAVLTTTATFDTEPKTLAERQEWFKTHGERHPVLVADVDSRVVGWSSLTEYSPRRAYDHTAETSVYVKSEFRGQGVGRKLQEAIIAEARRLKFHTLIARVTAESSESIRLHETCGFARAGEFKEVGIKFGRILDVYLLQMMLN